jgi:hypothetical protein
MKYWIAVREAMNPRTDEDAAMAHQRFGYGGQNRWDDREAARDALLRGLAREVESFAALGMPEGMGDVAEALAHLILNPTHNQANNGVVRWCVRQVGQ